MEKEIRLHGKSKRREKALENLYKFLGDSEHLPKRYTAKDLKKDEFSKARKSCNKIFPPG